MTDTNDTVRAALIKALLPDGKAIAYLLAGFCLGYTIGRLLGA